MARRMEWRELSDEFLLCRVLGHAWDGFHPLRRAEARKWKGWKVWSRCTRCTTTKSEAIDPRTGVVTARSYEYPEGYKTTKASRAEFRLEVKVRMR